MDGEVVMPPWGSSKSAAAAAELVNVQTFAPTHSGVHTHRFGSSDSTFQRTLAGRHGLTFCHI